MSSPPSNDPLPKGSQFEAVLGPPATRYFGGGFRRITQHAELCSAAEEDGNLALRGIGRARYPADWSLDASGRPREIHLSTFDALALVGLLIVQAAPGSSRANELARGSIRSFSIRAPGRAISVTDRVKVTVECSAPDVALGMWKVRARVAGFSINLDVAAEAHIRGTIDEQVLNHTQTGPLLNGRMISKAGSKVQTMHELATPAFALSCTEEMAMFGELSQFAVYTVKEVDRRMIPNLWLRSLSLVRSDQRPNLRISAVTEIRHDRLLRSADGPLVDLRLHSRTDYGTSVDAAFGYRLTQH